MKESYQPELFEKKRLDKRIYINDDNAFEMTRKLALEEGLFVGMSSGAVMAIAVSEAEQMKNGTIVMIFPDSGERYLSTNLFDIQQAQQIHFYNTDGNKKQTFSPMIAKKVSMYCCGPTAYSRANISECRRFVFYDLLRRYLEFHGYQVTQVMNITDLDDKTVHASMEAGQDLQPFTQAHIDSFFKDMEILGVKPASKYPRASEDIRDMIEWCEKLQDKGFAYEKLHSLYYNISRFKEYGQYSGIDWRNIQTGTVETDNYEKENPRDFTLFKRCRLSELKKGIYYKTRWGNVRPGWHTECAVLANKYLGSTFDIYAGNTNLIFPHQENMIAMSQALTGKKPAKYWLNCADFVFLSKTQEAELTLQQLLDKGYTGREIRFFLLSRHYRKPVKYTEENILHARKSLNRIDNCLLALKRITHTENAYKEIDSFIDNVLNDFTQEMDNDLNISSALGILYKAIRHIHIKLSADLINQSDAQKILDMFNTLDLFLNILPKNAAHKDKQINMLIQEREACRKNGEFQRADQIRDQLIAMGVQVQDLACKSISRGVKTVLDKLT
ncbi:MAG: cysteinyl-tRNA synthetase [Candidatus Magnetoglobus multicellularis str. Araruama]|uniref:Cysteine--tRNA ligase n=1 Tax=Candidatus Magnetoglobus multicellularis str. Araruama TaxID=890399 RepID=A0A1V1NZ30_9BACT|nr:MAG: cysteinyl-tRNA synthetase [Candidatus Magnetoglobus multicellularis str. Araruama]